MRSWAALYGISILAFAAMGYRSGLTGTNRSLVGFPVAFTFSVVIWLIADLDRPQEGILKVSQQAMIDLRLSMKRRPPNKKPAGVAAVRFLFTLIEGTCVPGLVSVVDAGADSLGPITSA